MNAGQIQLAGEFKKIIPEIITLGNQITENNIQMTDLEKKF
jgi:hypothetical protein